VDGQQLIEEGANLQAAFGAVFLQPHFQLSTQLGSEEPRAEGRIKTFTHEVCHAIGRRHPTSAHPRVGGRTIIDRRAVNRRRRRKEHDRHQLRRWRVVGLREHSAPAYHQTTGEQSVRARRGHEQIRDQSAIR
jgi:hypothetical protein